LSSSRNFSAAAEEKEEEEEEEEEEEAEARKVSLALCRVLFCKLS